MAFGFKSDPSRRYAYHVSRISREAENLLVEQIRKAHKFQNKLIEIELARRTKVRAAAVAASPDLERLEAEVAAIVAKLEEGRTALKAIRSRERDKKAGKPEAAALRELAKTLKPLRQLAKAARCVAYETPEARGVIAAIDQGHIVAVEAARKEAVGGGLHWPTAAVVAARVPKTGMPPGFVRWTGEGSVAIQFQRKGDKTSEEVPVLTAAGAPRLGRSGKPMTRSAAAKPLGAAELFAGTPLMKITPLPAIRNNPESGPSRKWVSIDWRIGSGPKGRPIMVKLDRVAMHRPIPPDATVKWAHLQRTVYGTRSRWEIQFTIAKPAWEPKPRAESGTVAVALGWRMIDGDLRIGHWLGSDGKSGDIVVPKSKLARWKFSDDLQSLRDKQLNDMKLRFAAFVSGTEEFSGRPDTFVIPDWFREEVAFCKQWRSPGRFVRLLRLWRDQRFPGDETYFAELTGRTEVCDDGKTRYSVNSVLQDGHLYDWRMFTLRKARRWRKAMFRHLACELSRSYRNVACGEIDWAELGKDRPPESGQPDVNKTNKGIASIAGLREILETRLDAVRVDPVGIARTCSACGTDCGPLAASRWLTCSTCGDNVKIDRLVNAARNLLKRALAEQK